MAQLDNSVCVITGAAFGIGRATAVRFAAEGARLVITDIQEGPLLALADELRDSGAEVEAVAGDVSLVDDARRMIQTAVDRYGRLDVLVANAGIIPLGDILESTVEDWDQVMAVDGRGMWLTCKYAIEAMLPTGGGAIICLSSISGVEGQKRQSTYGPAKFVASGITKHLAIEWADRGIRVNAVAPGTIRTCRRSQAASNTWRRLSGCTPWVASASQARSPPRSCFSPQPTPRSSPASSCRSTAAIWRNRRSR
jgi:NAD(P)-dependent dehydrogenase (short-subunit alcohol dehydrogenase family)